MEKTYQVRLRYPLASVALARLEGGVVLNNGARTAPARARIVSRDRRRVEVTIREGKKRQVKRMFLAVNNRVDYLKRVAVGPIKLGDLPRGKWRKLEPAEITALKSADRT